MLLGKRIVVVMPAYNAQYTIEKTWREVVAQQVVDLVIIVDDASRDATFAVARTLNNVIVHSRPILIVPLTSYDYQSAFTWWPRRVAKRLLRLGSRRRSRR